MRGREDAADLGVWLGGYIDGLDVPRKVIADKTGIDQATLSRIFNGHRDCQGRTLARICFAAGEHFAANHRPERTS